MTTYGPGVGSLPLVASETLTDFYNGLATTYTQAFPSRTTQPVKLFNLGFYGQDTWQARRGLSLTFTIRADRASNPGCVTNCFNRLNTDFLSANHALTDPYDSTILSGQSNALRIPIIQWTIQPRFGFNLTHSEPTLDWSSWWLRNLRQHSAVGLRRQPDQQSSG